MDIEKQTTISTAPSIFRSKFVYLYGTNLCMSILVLVKKWYLYQINSNDFTVIQTVDLSTNPTNLQNQLVIFPNKLDYGLFKTVFEVQSADEFSTNIFVESIETYFRIIPTGLAVFSLANGVSNLEIGYEQSIDLEPDRFSFDFDKLATINLLKFTYYCKIVDSLKTNLDYLNEDLLTKMVSS